MQAVAPALPKGGYHCLHKLAAQMSETAYEKSGGACRPKAVSWHVLAGGFEVQALQVVLRKNPFVKIDLNRSLASAWHVRKQEF